MQIDTLELTKYKRFFAFGCSFTFFNWPTWADIIGTQIPEYHNYGLPGVGNLGIFNQLVEANKRHKFTKDDLVIVMWSDTFREDRYVKKKWLTYGNIFLHQTPYDKKFVEKFACERGYLIRDMACIDTAKTVLDGSGCDWDFLAMVNQRPPHSTFSDVNFDDVSDLYKDTLDIIKPDVLTAVYDGNYENRKDEMAVVRIDGNKTQKDLHPIPNLHYEYLQKIYGVVIPLKIVTRVAEISKMIMDGPIEHDQTFTLIERKPVKRF